MPKSKSKYGGWGVVNQSAQAGLIHQSPEDLPAAAARYRDKYLQGSDNTKLAYAADLRSYEQFCHKQELIPYPADLLTLTDYLAYLADNQYKLATRLVPK